MFEISDKRLADFLQLVLPLSGVLLGLVFAGLTFLLETGIKSLEYTRDLVREVFTRYAKIILRLLTYVTIVSLFALENFNSLIVASFFIFTILFIKSALDYVSYAGYIETMFSSKFIPTGYSKTRQYFRKIRNAGLKPWVRLGPAIFLINVLPLYWMYKTRSYQLSNEGIYLSLFAALVLVVIELPSLITQTFDIQKQIAKKREEKNLEKAEALEDLEEGEAFSKEQIEIQSSIAKENIKQLGIRTIYELGIEDVNWQETGNPVLQYEPIVNEYGTLHLNLILPELEGRPQRLREMIIEWVEKIMKSFQDWDTDILDIALSFWSFDGKTHLAIFRGRPAEIENIISFNGRDFVKKLRNKYLTSLVSEDLKDGL